MMQICLVQPELLRAKLKFNRGISSHGFVRTDRHASMLLLFCQVPTAATWQVKIDENVDEDVGTPEEDLVKSIV